MSDLSASNESGKNTVRELNLRGVACPMNFVKTKLFLDKMQAGEVVKVLLDPGEPVESVTTSIRQEGHEILQSIQMVDESQDPVSSANSLSLGFFCLTIRKV
jgi:TusA-related sulfurtransferase